MSDAANRFITGIRAHVTIGGLGRARNKPCPAFQKSRGSGPAWLGGKQESGLGP